MPGTILVSVLEFLGLPFSSSTSTISIKVSLGKKEYQTWDKGEFSFPLTTLRETLVVVVQDEKGNEISYAGVETKSIVEKGVWDDIFPLEGGGKVHLKLQFVLNEDEKNRIRIMRESAMKKNQNGLLNCRSSSLERVANDASNIASSLYHENTDKNEERPNSPDIPSLQRDDSNTSQVNRRELVEKVEAQSLSADTPITKAVYTKELSSSTRSSESGSSSKKRASLERTPSQVNRRESVEKVEARSLSADTPITKAVYSKESSSSTRSSESGSSSKKRASMERTPSSVKRMISAFENNLSQDIRPQTKPIPEKREVNKIGQEFKTQVSGKLEKSSTTKVRGQGIDINPNSKVKVDQKEPEEPDKDKPNEDLMKKPKIGTFLAPEESLYEHRQQSSYNVGSSKEESGDSSVVVKESRAKNSPKSRQSSTAQRTSNHKLTTVDDHEDLYKGFEISGAWIFPDHHRRFCATTGGNKVMDFLDGQSLEMNISMPQKNSGDGDSQSETNPESEGVESSRGLIEQVMKVAIMVGFGLLVLLTRQRNNR